MKKDKIAGLLDEGTITTQRTAHGDAVRVMLVELVAFQLLLIGQPDLTDVTLNRIRVSGDVTF